MAHIEVRGEFPAPHPIFLPFPGSWNHAGCRQKFQGKPFLLGQKIKRIEWGLGWSFFKLLALIR